MTRPDSSCTLRSAWHNLQAKSCLEGVLLLPVRPLSDAYFSGLEATYGFPVPREAGAALQCAAATGLAERSAHLLGLVSRHIPDPEPDLYIGPLFGMAPAATIAVDGRPAIAIGAEMFHPHADRRSYPRRSYHPDELEEIVPHEAAHVARMRSLALPPTPQSLSLLEMVMLEGTALTFTDLLVGRRTLETFLPPAHLALHDAHMPQILSSIAREWETTGGMPAFLRWFSAGSWPSGYYAGYVLCRDYVRRLGEVPVTVPSRAILASLQSPVQSETPPV